MLTGGRLNVNGNLFQPSGMATQVLIRIIGFMKRLEILLVEDSPSDVRLIREVLGETALHVAITVARDGVEAMDYLLRSEHGLATRPDLILLDLNLPRKNGREVLAEVKAAPKLKQIPVLVMTSSKADEDVAAAYSLNANCYITKPGDLAEYVKVVRAIENFWFFTAVLPDSLPGLGLGSPQLHQAAPEMARATTASEPV